MSVPYVTLNNGIKCPILGLGTWNSPKDSVKQAVIDAIKAGYRHIDCALIYGNEYEVGEAIKECIPSICKREDLFITTKLWLTDFDDVESGIKVSLKRLDLEYVDLYLIHHPIKISLSSLKRDPNDHKNWIPPFDFSQYENYSKEWMTKLWKNMELLVDKGYTRSIGISNFNTKRTKELLEICRIKPVINQVEMHPYMAQPKLIKFCRDNGIYLTAYSPLGSPGVPGLSRIENIPIPLSDQVVTKIGLKYKKSPAQILIKWAIKRDTIVIPKSTNKERIYENINIFDFDLTDEDMNEINQLNKNLTVFSWAHILKTEEEIKDMWDRYE